MYTPCTNLHPNTVINPNNSSTVEKARKGETQKDN